MKEKKVTLTTVFMRTYSWKKSESIPQRYKVFCHLRESLDSRFHTLNNEINKNEVVI